MHQHSNDPLHLGQAGTMPVATAAHCADCGEGHRRGSLQNFAGALRCDPCIRAGMCKSCRSAMAVPGHDECVPCQVAFYTANPEEFEDAVERGLCRTEEGSAIARSVLIPKGTTVLQLQSMSLAASRAGRAEIAEVLFRAAANARRVAA